MYNFLDSKLLPRVSTSSPFTEGFEPENLIAKEFIRKGRGFIAYATIKPPVTIDFEFICNISLSHIVINARNGNHKSNGIEILAKSNDSDYVTISKVNFDQDGVVICNSKRYSKSRRPPNTNNEYYLAFFKANEFKTFLNVSHIKVRILRTNFTVPCLGGIEIWGSTSSSCSKVTIETIEKLFWKINSNTPIINNISNSSLNEFEIPEEFLDEITYEVMALPMTLPSGHSVDQSTLEKCCSTDISCGRHPIDPFTGLQFSDERKPVLNSALKARIDMFLFQNAHREETVGIKRTLGRSSITKRNQFCSVSESHNNKRVKFDDNRATASLDDALTEVLNSKDFIRFSDKDSGNSSSIRLDECGKCKMLSPLYVLPCEHIYCKGCLLSSSNFCMACKRKYSNNEIVIHHN